MHRVEQNPGDAVLGGHAPRRHRDDRQAARQVPERHDAADPHRAAAAGRGDVPEDADRDGSAQARQVPQDREQALHAGRAQALAWRHRPHRQGDRGRPARHRRPGRGGLRREGLRAAADRGDRVAARPAALRLEAALRLDEPHDRRQRPRVPGGRRGQRRHRPPGDDRAVPVLREARRGEEEEPGATTSSRSSRTPRWTARSCR